MYYILYLTSLCRRRNWPEPIYNAHISNRGYTCTVRVNNREYRTDSICSNETLARESAAMRAYLICRNFSVNDGMYPAGHEHGGAVQGMRVAIGVGRKAAREDDVLSLGSASGSGAGSDGSQGGSWSGAATGSPAKQVTSGDHHISSYIFPNWVHMYRIMPGTQDLSLSI
ncbi:hypothetical protein N7501_009856 [Penicillium viridicatum]|nr:hypothetical protein N7501_009856 [Penicillium viridicatum]